MRRSTSFVAFCAALLFVAACRDTGPTGANPSRRTTNVRKADATPGTCTTPSNINSLINTVFGAGSPNANSALGKFDNLNKALKRGDLAGAQDQAHNLVSFVQTKAASGGLPGTQSQIQLLINSVLCYAGLLDDAFLVYPSDQPQTLVNSTGKTGIGLPANPVSEPTLVTITVLPPGAASPLITKLDQYPAFVVITTTSGLAVGKTAVVGVCTAAGIPTNIANRLKLGHQATGGFEIPPSGDPSFLDCTGVAQSRAPGWLKRLASYVTPKTLYAKQEEFSRGVGATVTEFSPFGPVDPEIQERSGVGSTVTEFNKVPTKGTDKSLPLPTETTTPSSTKQPASASLTRVPGARVNTVVADQCTAIDAIVGQSVESLCRPYIVFTTFNGTIIQNVPVNWAITSGGGTTAPELSGGACGTFGSTASNTSDVNGRAAVCWNLGSTPGANTLVATPAVGGDAPLGVVFAGPHITFTASALQITPTVDATGGSFVYDGSDHAGSGICSNGLTPDLSYTPAGVPKNVGEYTLTVTCGAGNPLYVTVHKDAAISITPAVTATSVTCSAGPFAFTNSAITPCEAKVTGPGLLLEHQTPTYSANVNAGTATASYSYAAGGNYQASSGSANFQIGQAATITMVNCPASVPYTGTARTPCTASVTGPGLSLTPTPTYVSNVNAGTATASVSYAGGGNYAPSAGSTNFQITAVATQASVNCPVSVTYTGSAVTPCSGLVTGPGLNQAVTPTYTSNIVGTATATVNYAGGGNYGPSTASKNFQILYVQSGCFSSPVYSVMPQTKSSQNKGSNLPVKCALVSASGAGVTNATGNLVVTDLGINQVAGSAPACQRATAPFNPVAFSGNNVFKTSGSGNYAYGLDTSPAAFITGHYYCATASWNDGSTTIGYFFIK